MPGPLQAIETLYKGYRFRSRLEARWAVFFDELEIAYEYEPQGYKLASGACYLPDFYLPAMKVHAEVKAGRDFAFSDFERCVEFSAAEPLLLIIGTPWEASLCLLPRSSAAVVALMREDCSMDDEAIRGMLLAEDFSGVLFRRSPITNGWTLVCSAMPPPHEWALESARNAAKGARFEHGEQGAHA